MINIGTVDIDSQRLLLRRFMNEDYKDYFEGIAKREECSRYFPWNETNDINIVKKRIERWIDSYKDNEYYQWVIVLKSSKKLVGSINLHCVDTDNNSAETSFLLNPEFWNQGIMSEALSLIIKFGFNELKLNRIYSDFFMKMMLQKKFYQKLECNTKEYQDKSTIKMEYI